MYYLQYSPSVSSVLSSSWVKHASLCFFCLSEIWCRIYQSLSSLLLEMTCVRAEVRNSSKLSESSLRVFWGFITANDPFHTCHLGFAKQCSATSERLLKLEKVAIVDFVNAACVTSLFLLRAWHWLMFPIILIWTKWLHESSELCDVHQWQQKQKPQNSIIMATLF